MRFNDRTCLEFLENGINCDLTISRRSSSDEENKEMEIAIKNFFSQYRIFFKQKVRYITRPFYTAYASAAPKLIQVFKGEPMGIECGTFIISIGDSAVKTLFYAIEEDTVDEGMFICFEFVRSKEYPDTRIESVIMLDKGQNNFNYYLSDGHLEIK